MRHTRLVSDWSSDVCSSDLGRDCERGRGRAVLGHPGPGHEWRGRADGRALSAAGRNGRGSVSGSLLLKGGRVIDPKRRVDAVLDVLIEDGHVAAIDKNVKAKAANVVDVSGLVVAPGFIDLHTHLREPGREDKETIATGTRAAAQ